MPESLTTLLQAKLEMCEKATKGPWQVDWPRKQLNIPVLTTEDSPRHICSAMRVCLKAKEIEANADFIASARTDLPNAYKALMVAVEALDRVGEERQDIYDGPGICRAARSRISELLSVPPTENSNAH